MSLKPPQEDPEADFSLKQLKPLSKSDAVHRIVQRIARAAGERSERSQRDRRQVGIRSDLRSQTKKVGGNQIADSVNRNAGTKCVAS